MTKSSSLESENINLCITEKYYNRDKFLQTTILEDQLKHIFYAIYHLNNKDYSTSFPVIINDVNKTLNNFEKKIIDNLNENHLIINDYFKKKIIYKSNIFFIIIIFILLLVILCIVLLFKL